VFQESKLISEAGEVCRVVSLLEDLNRPTDLKALKDQIVDQKALAMPPSGWIDEISRKMGPLLQRASKKKLDNLASQIGGEKVNSYLAAAILGLMTNHGLLRFRAADQ